MDTNTILRDLEREFNKRSGDISALVSLRDRTERLLEELDDVRWRIEQFISNDLEPQIQDLEVPHPGDQS